MTKVEMIKVTENKITELKELRKTLTNPKYIEDCDRDIEQIEKLLYYENLLK